MASKQLRIIGGSCASAIANLVGWIKRSEPQHLVALEIDDFSLNCLSYN